jgi:hypothetical protein
MLVSKGPISKECGKLTKASEYITTPELPATNPLGMYGCTSFPGCVTIDGLLAEIHPTPSTCREWVLEHIRSCLYTLINQVNTRNGDVLVSSTIKVPKKVIREATEEELELGCEPDFSAYSGEVNIISDKLKQGNIRTGGGHIHFGKNGGYDRNFVQFISPSEAARCKTSGQYAEYSADETFKPIAQNMIMAMDYFCGIPSILLDDDNAAIRRKMYGQAGAYRIQPHGIEYRVLSNFWVYHPALASLVYQLARTGYYMIIEQPLLFEEMIEAIKPSIIQKTINTNDKDGARELSERILPFYRKITGGVNGFEYPIEFALYVDMLGKENIFNGNLVDNWRMPSPEEKKITLVSHQMGYRDLVKRDWDKDLRTEFKEFGRNIAKKLKIDWGLNYNEVG